MKKRLINFVLNAMLIVLISILFAMISFFFNGKSLSLQEIGEMHQIAYDFYHNQETSEYSSKYDVEIENDAIYVFRNPYRFKAFNTYVYASNHQNFISIVKVPSIGVNIAFAVFVVLMLIAIVKLFQLLARNNVDEIAT